MVRVPLPFRGVAVLLLAASTVAGQTPEPPAELPLEPSIPRSTDFLRQYSGDLHHPLLSLLVEGDLTSLDAGTLPPKETASRLAPKAQSGGAKPALTEVGPGAIEVGAGACEIECPTTPTCLPFCPPPPPPPCHCRKCQRMHKHRHCGNYGPGYGCNYGGGYGGNPYLNWPCGMGGCPGCYGPAPYQGCCSHKSRHKHGCGCGPMYPGCGYPYGGGCGSGYGGGYGGGYGSGCGMGYGGFMDGGCGDCMPYIAPPPPPPPPPCWCHKCQRKHGCGHQGCGYPGYGYGGWGSGYGGGYGGGWGMMGNDGFMDGGFGGCCAPYAPPPMPSCSCHKCQRKHGCSPGYGYAGCGYPGWPAYPVPGWNQWDCGSNNCGKSCGGGCCKRRGCWSHHGHGCQQPAPYPYWAYPQATPCMRAEPFCGDCAFDGGFGSAPLLSGTCQ